MTKDEDTTDDTTYIEKRSGGPPRVCPLCDNPTYMEGDCLECRVKAVEADILLHDETIQNLLDIHDRDKLRGRVADLEGEKLLNRKRVIALEKVNDQTNINSILRRIGLLEDDAERFNPGDPHAIPDDGHRIQPKDDEATITYLKMVKHLCWCCYQMGAGQEWNWPPTEDQLASQDDAVHYQLQKWPHLSPESNHVNWMAFKVAEGWEYGPVKDVEAKTHPDLVPYSELPEVERMKDEMDIMAFNAGLEILHRRHH